MNNTAVCKNLLRCPENVGLSLPGFACLLIFIVFLSILQGTSLFLIKLEQIVITYK